MAGNEPITPSSVEELLTGLESTLATQWHAKILDLGKGVLKLGFIHKTNRYESGRWFYLGLVDEIDDAEAYVIFLDLLESLGFEPVLFPIYEDPDTFTNIIGYRCDLHKIDWHSEHEGETRSEAVARAVLAVLQQEGNANV